MQRLEYDSYYKFLVSMGIVLVVSPIIILGVFLSGRFDLIMSQADFESLCAGSARAVNLHFTIAKVMPWAYLVCSIAAFIAGIWLIHSGCKKWKVIQLKQDKKLNLEVEGLKNQVHNMSPEEKANNKIDEILESQKYMHSSSEMNLDDSSIETGKIIARKVLEYIEAEDKCAKIIRNEIGAEYTVMQDVMVGNYIYDIVAHSNTSKEDVVYEIKVGEDIDINNLIKDSIPPLIKRAEEYSKANKKYVRAELWITIGNEVPDYSYRGLSGIDHEFDIPFSVRFIDIEREETLRKHHINSSKAK